MSGYHEWRVDERLLQGCVLQVTYRTVPGGNTRTRHFCGFCKRFIPVPGTSVSSVRFSYPYQQLLRDLETIIPVPGVRLRILYPCPKPLWVLYSTHSIPETCLTSIRGPYTYPKLLWVLEIKKPYRKLLWVLDAGGTIPNLWSRSRSVFWYYMWPKPLENPFPPPPPFFFPDLSCSNAPPNIEIRQSNNHFHALDITSLYF